MAKKKKKAAAGDDEAEEKSKKKPMIIGAVVLAGLAYKFVLAPAPAEPVEGEADAELTDQAERVLVDGLIFPMEELVVNLADSDDDRYLRVGLALVLEEGIAVELIEPEAAIAIDAAIDYLSAQTFELLKQPGSKSVVRDELSILIREAYGDEKVTRILLTTFVMQ